MAERLLEVNDLSVRFATEDGTVRAVDGISLELERGKVLGIVGESGSGKSVTAMTLLGLTRDKNTRFEGTVEYRGRSLLEPPESELQNIRGNELAMIFQDPMTTLNPVYRVGDQIVEAIRTHEDTSKAAARRRVVELLRQVGIPNPERRIDDYPHQFSGGMRQRAMIAMALALSPKLLIADEPTTALDVTVQAQIIDLMKSLQHDFGTAIIMITHDLGALAEIADDVMVMYAGQAMEHGDRQTVYRHAHHPYTHGLLGALPSRRGVRLTPIPGLPPSLINPPNGCPFHPRCPQAFAPCSRDQPPLAPVDASGHLSACWLPPALERAS